MQINLKKKIDEHFRRVEALAVEAENDESQSYSSRASAMVACSNMLKELTKSRADVYNMERLMKIEQITVEVVKEFLTTEQIESFLSRLDQQINK